MEPKVLARLQRLIREGNYDISIHAAQEAAEDDLHPVDIESAILSGTIIRVEKGDPRGPKYVVVGAASDLQQPVGVIVRFKTPDRCRARYYQASILKQAEALLSRRSGRRLRVPVARYVKAG